MIERSGEEMCDDKTGSNDRLGCSLCVSGCDCEGVQGDTEALSVHCVHDWPRVVQYVAVAGGGETWKKMLDDVHCVTECKYMRSAAMVFLKKLLGQFREGCR